MIVDRLLASSRTACESDRPSPQIMIIPLRNLAFLFHVGGAVRLRRQTSRLALAVAVSIALLAVAVPERSLE